MPKKIAEMIKTDLAIAPVAAGAGGKTSSWFSMQDYGRARGVGLFASTTGTTANLYILQAKDADGAGAKTLTTVTVATDDVTASKPMLTSEIAVGDMDVANDFSHLQVKVTYGSANEVAAVFERGDPSFAPPR